MAGFLILIFLEQQLSFLVRRLQPVALGRLCLRLLSADFMRFVLVRPFAHRYQIYLLSFLL
jgi:hypothetical protein